MAETLSCPAGVLVEAVGLLGSQQLNGKRGKTNGTVQNERIGIVFPPPDGTKALRLANVIRLSDTVAVIRQKAGVGSLSSCDDFASALWAACVQATIVAHSKVRLLPENIQDLLSHEPPTGKRQMFWLQLDAIGHHLILEQRTKDEWRSYQSAAPILGFEGSGYTGLQWISKEPVGAYGVHQRWGQGQILTLTDISKLLAQVQHLRDLSDDLLKEELTKQGPFPPCSWPSTNAWCLINGENCLTTAQQAAHDEWVPWAESIDPLRRWACEQIEEAKERPMRYEQIEDGKTMAIYFGTARENTPELLRISMQRATPIGAAYSELTGQGPTPVIWLKQLAFVTYKMAWAPGANSLERIGWTYKVMEL